MLSLDKISLLDFFDKLKCEAVACFVGINRVVTVFLFCTLS